MYTADFIRSIESIELIETYAVNNAVVSFYHYLLSKPKFNRV